MGLLYKENFEETAKYWDAFWLCETINRPLLCITAPKKGFESGSSHGVSYRQIVEATTQQDFANIMKDFDDFAQSHSFLGEAVPFFKLDYGPDMFASFLGSRLFCLGDVNTTWVEPSVTDWRDFECTMGNTTEFTTYFELLKYACNHSRGKYMISMPDIHGGMDALSALRSPQNLCYDLYDHPNEVADALMRIRREYLPFLNAIFEAGCLTSDGSIGWSPCFSRSRSAVVQCDFAALVGPEFGKKYVIPTLEEEVSYLDNTIYHYDGKEALIHLDDILAIDGINAIQWVPGDGQPRTLYWMDLLHKIQAAGKGLWIYDWTPEEIKQHFKELSSEGLVFSVHVNSEDEGYELIDFVQKNM